MADIDEDNQTENFVDGPGVAFNCGAAGGVYTVPNLAKVSEVADRIESDNETVTRDQTGAMIDLTNLVKGKLDFEEYEAREDARADRLAEIEDHRDGEG